jgi:hypothetical protein
MIQQQDLLKTVLDTLCRVMTAGVNAATDKVDCSSQIFEHNYYWIFVSDISTILSHAPFADYVIAKRPDLQEQIFDMELKCEAMNPIVRMVTTHVVYEVGIYSFMHLCRSVSLCLSVPERAFVYGCC